MKRIKTMTMVLCVMLSIVMLTACANDETGGNKSVMTPPPVGNSREPDETEPVPTEEQLAPTEGIQSGLDLRVYLNGNRLPLETQPVSQGESVMLPVEEICGFFSREIAFAQEGDVLTITDEGRSNTIVITAGSKTAKVNGTDVQMEAPALLAQDGVMLLEFACFQTLLDCEVQMNEGATILYITESGLC